MQAKHSTNSCLGLGVCVCVGGYTLASQVKPVEGASGHGPIAWQLMPPWTPVAMAAASCPSCHDAQWPQGTCE